VLGKASKSAKGEKEKMFTKKKKGPGQGPHSKGGRVCVFTEKKKPNVPVPECKIIQKGKIELKIKANKRRIMRGVEKFEGIRRYKH